jgi:hypothetical protein
MRISIPPNTAGEVVIPAPAQANRSVVSESGKAVWQAGCFVPRASPGVLSGWSAPIATAGDHRGEIHLVIGSGNYSFSASLPAAGQ